MKFVCDNCSTHYLISDEKVGQHGVKVRCKRCGNVILVAAPRNKDSQEIDSNAGDATNGEDAAGSDGQPVKGAGDQDELGQAFEQLIKDGGDESGEDNEAENGEERATRVFSSDELEQLRARKERQGDEEKIDRMFSTLGSTELSGTPAATGRPDEHEWFAAIRDEQVGPLSLSEILKLWDTGEITSRTLTWHAGMDDWQPVQGVSELAGLLGRKEEVEHPFEGETDQRNESNAAGEGQREIQTETSSLASLVEEEIAAVKSFPPPEEKELPDDAIPNDDSAPWEREEVKSGEVAKPPDSFFDSTLDSRTTGSGSGAFFDDSYGRPGQTMARPAYLDTGIKRRSFRKLVLIGSVGLVVLIGGVVVVLRVVGQFGSSSGAAEHVQDPAASGNNLPIANPGGSSSKGSVDPATSKERSDGGSGEGAKEASAPVEKVQKVGDANDKAVIVANPIGSRAGAPDDRRQRADGRKNLAKRPIKGNPADGQGESRNQPQKEPSSDSEKKPTKDSEEIKRGLSREDVNATMKQYVQAMKGCVEQQQQRDPGVTGTMYVSFEIENSGKVKTVNVISEEHKGTYIAGCITFIIKSMKFPKFKGDPFPIPKFPFRLGG